MTLLDLFSKARRLNNVTIEAQLLTFKGCGFSWKKWDALNMAEHYESNSQLKRQDVTQVDAFNDWGFDGATLEAKLTKAHKNTQWEKFLTEHRTNQTIKPGFDKFIHKSGLDETTALKYLLVHHNPASNFLDSKWRCVFSMSRKFHLLLIVRQNVHQRNI